MPESPSGGIAVPLEGPGSVIGPYKLLQQIGEGGFGTVFMAEQEHPIRRRVALKILKPGMDTRQVVARFEAERQALALMDHPNIARVLDAGATSAGRPYFAMELVKGIPIQQYCDTQRLSTRERLELFTDVCRAVQHAHQKGIIHRDLKPSNILVGLQDGRAVPKVIDFGIAKALERKLTDKTLFTEFRQMIGTPAYMSPEQTEISGLDVDTRSDIYSLGVLLYELLTGALPFDLARLQQAGYGEILRIIREEEPARPSTKVSTLSGTTAAVAACRRTEPGKLGALLRGELDWIVMKTLEKERARRYETADALAADVQRYLDDEPVLAGAPSRVYRARKFVLRHRVGVLTSAALLLLLGIGLAGTSVGLLRAKHASARARQHTLDAQRKFELARKGAELISNVDLSLAGGTRALKRSLAEAVLKYNEKLGAEQQSDLNETIRIRDSYSRLSRACLELDEISLAQKACDRHLELAARLASKFPDSPMVKLDASFSLALFASIARKQGDFASALEKDEQALLALGSESDWKTYDVTTKRMIAWTHQELAHARFNESEFKAAREHFTQARDKYTEIVSLGSPYWFDRMDLGRAYVSLGKLAGLELGASVDDAQQNLGKAQEIAVGLQRERPNDPDVLMFSGEVAVERGHCLERTGDYGEASKSYATALELAERLAAEDPRYPVALTNVCAACYSTVANALRLGNVELAQELCSLSLETSRQVLEMEPGNPISADARLMALESAAKLANQLEEWAKQEAQLQEWIEIGEKLDKERPTDRNVAVTLLTAYAWYGRLALKARQPGRAEERFLREMEYAKRQLKAAPESHSAQFAVAGAWADLGEASWTAGRHEQGLERSNLALIQCQALEKAEPKNPEFLRAESKVREVLGRCAMDWGDLNQAREHFEAQLRIRLRLHEYQPGNSRFGIDLSQVYVDLTLLEMRAGHFKQAGEQNARARTQLEGLLMEEPTNAAAIRQLMQVESFGGEIEMAGQHWGEARKALQRGVELCQGGYGDNPSDRVGQALAGGLCEHMGEVCFQLGRLDEAREFTQRALSLQLKLAEGPAASASEVNNVAWLLATCNPEDLRDPKLAIDCALRGIRQTEHHDEHLLDTLANAYFANGQLQEAVDTQVEALGVLKPSEVRRHAQFEGRLAKYRAALAAKNTADTAKESPK